MATSPIGTAVERVDGRAKVTGTARYAADHHPRGLAYGHLVLSTVAKGTVRAMRVDAAREAPGVVAVYTPFNPLPYAGPWLEGPLNSTGPNYFPLQPGDRRVRHHGQVVAMVVAETFEQARDAAALIETSYDVEQARTSFTNGLPDAVTPPPRPPAQGLPPVPAVEEHLQSGYESIDQALAASEVTVSATFSQRPEHHNPMEPHAAVAAWGRDGRLTIHSGNQGPLMHAAEIAYAMDIDVERVHVVSPHVGGGFGAKVATWAPTVLAAAAARETGRPVKLTLTREQLYTVTGHRLATHQRIDLGAARDGTLHAIRHDCVTAKPATSNADGGFARYSQHVYASPNIYTANRTVTLDVPPGTIMRAPGEEPSSFALECAMDELAYRLGIDPVELRRLNNAATHPISGLPYSSKHLDECMTVGAARFDWSRRPRTPGTLVDGEWSTGMGMAIGVFGAMRYPISTHVAFRRDGTVAVEAATSDPGTGMTTVVALMAADSLGVPVARVESVVGDNAVRSQSPQGWGLAAGSAGTASVAPAVQDASKAAVDALIQHAVTRRRSPFRGLDPEDVRYRDGRLSAAGRSVGFGELLAATRTDAVGAEKSSGPGEEFGQYALSTFAAHFAEVRVNRFTGETRLARMTTVVDAGTILNTAAARNQIVGSVTFGLGQALLEGAEVEPATGRIANANFADYLVPVNADIPDIDVHFLDHPDTVISPLGSRGVGEIGTIGSAAAIANAVSHATGKRIRDLPITPDKLIG